MMNTLFYLTVMITLLFSACSGKNTLDKFVQTASGMQYQVFQNGMGDFPRHGQFLKMQVQQFYNDSLLNDTRHSLPQYQALDSSQISEDAYQIFSRLQVGDSLIFKWPSDSAFKDSKPPFATKEGWLITHVKIEAILNPVEVEADLNFQKAKLQPPTPYNSEE